MSNAIRYAIVGAVFGLLFPVLGTAVVSWTEGIGWLDAQRTAPLLWIIDTAPAFLGLFAAFAGVRQDRVEALATDLRAQVAHAEEARALALDAEERALAGSAAKSAFLATMSHELRTPLNAILGYSELLIDEIDDEAAHRDLDRIARSASHLRRLIDEVLDLSRIEAGRFELNEHPTDLVLLLEQVAQTVSGAMAAQGNTFHVELSPDLGVAVVDPLRTKQVALNLLSNAARFTEQGEVRLAGEVRGDQIQLTVEDTGIGMSAAELDRVFDPFVQVDPSTTTAFGGTGLGLTLVDRFVKKMGGRLEVRSTPGIGSTFGVRLPLRRPATD